MLALADASARSGADPFDRHHYDPGHFTASAFVLDPEGTELLLIWHTKLGCWVQPGGHVEPADRDLDAAARREVAEEAGVDRLEKVGDGLFDLDVHLIPARRGEPEHRHLDVRLLYRAVDTRLVSGSDAGDARWVPFVDIDPAGTDESVLRAVRKIRGIIRGRRGAWTATAATATDT
jgi:8-oxo-dGTP pyrophosphatase MutT (NUDIX family)